MRPFATRVVAASAAFMFVCAVMLTAQIPQSMNYQAVVRDASNELLGNQRVGVRISIVQGALSGTAIYSETHQCVTNQNGLVTFEIGKGTPVVGSFVTIDWARGPYYVRTETDVTGGQDYSVAGTSPLLSVPYALRAQTAESALDVKYSDISDRPLNVSAFFNDVGYVTRQDLGLKIGKDGEIILGNSGVPSNVWSQQGNSGTNPGTDKLGTTDSKDLVFITNNTERFRIKANGDITLQANLSIGTDLSIGDDLEVGDDATIGDDLTVKNNVYLNTVGGSTTNYGPFTVESNSATHLTGTLDVDGEATLNNTLDVDGATTLNNTLDVDGESEIHNTLLVDSDQEDHVVTIENTNGDEGDGLLIKLGRTHGAWDGDEYLQIANPATILAGSTLNTVKGWLNGSSFSVEDLWTIFPGAAIAGALAQVTNTIIDEINDGLGLPFTVVPNVNVFPGYTLNLPDVPSIEMPKVCLSFGELGSACAGPWTLFGGLTIPNIEIPSLNIGPYELPAIPNIPANGLPTIEIPNFSGTNVANSLTRENHYITFQDKAGRQTGAIKAESVADWRDNTVLEEVYLTNLAASFIGIDLLGAAVTGFSEITQTVKAYNEIGVAYESGNGDYAEWLERADHAEHIGAGDVVGVRGGKISKSLEGAEQVMVVSHQPIVLGNMPDAQQRRFGNDVAFMGQVPVRVMGPVSTGDFIVASGTIAGYAVGISPRDMTTEDHARVVGRSWENMPASGPKMVNTVIGVHNGEWVKIVKKIETRQAETERRVLNIEAKLKEVLGEQNTAENRVEAP